MKFLTIIRVITNGLKYFDEAASSPYTDGILYILQWAAPFPSKLPLPMGDMDPDLVRGSLGPPESRTQMASRSVQPFFARLTAVTDRLTDHASVSVAIGRICVRSDVA